MISTCTHKLLAFSILLNDVNLIVMIYCLKHVFQYYILYIYLSTLVTSYLVDVILDCPMKTKAKTNHHKANELLYFHNYSMR